MQLFENFGFLIQMLKTVFVELRFFLFYYVLVMLTFGIVFKVIFKDPSEDSQGAGPFSYLIMSLRIVWGDGEFDINKTEFKGIAWVAYILLMLTGNIILMNFLIAAV